MTVLTRLMCWLVGHSWIKLTPAQDAIQYCIYCGVVRRKEDSK